MHEIGLQPVQFAAEINHASGNRRAKVFQPANREAVFWRVE
jgi:hypothetical protein